jgi:uncharacterized protein YndB with AHSA1/START domain
MNTQTLSFSQMVKAPPAEVYRAFTNATALREWLCNVATVAPRAGGRLYLWWNSGFYTSGEFITAEPHEKIAFTWHGRGEPAPSKVQITFTAKDGGTQVAIEHMDLGTSEEWSKSIPEIENGWKKGLENLASVLETGEDLRFVLRPMLGIFFGDYNADKAKELGVPVNEGIRLEGVVEGMGAQAAGMQKDDVVVSMAGVPTPDYFGLENALQHHRAGDQIEVVLYRGAEKKSLTMQLSRRPIPEIPATAKELADAVRKRYAELEAELDNFFTSVSEEEASFKPARAEWSVKENLAHLIQGERGTQSYLADLVSGQERYADDFGDNVHAYVEATVATYPTLVALIQELKRSDAETAEFIARLPAEFVARKGSYWRMAFNLLDSPFHFHEHVAQMTAAIDAARKK